MWEAIETYMERKQPLIIVAGADYGQGSSCDKAAVPAGVGDWLKVSSAFTASLIGMGVMPAFRGRHHPQDPELDGTESTTWKADRPRAPDLMITANGDVTVSRCCVVWIRQKKRPCTPTASGRNSPKSSWRKRAKAVLAVGASFSKRFFAPARPCTLPFRRSLPAGGLLFAGSPPPISVEISPPVPPPGFFKGAPWLMHLRLKSPLPTCVAASARAFFQPERPARGGHSRRGPHKILLRVIGSPDPYGKQTDGMAAPPQHQQDRDPGQK